MEQQKYDQMNRRINILIGVAGVAMVVGLVGLVIGLMRPTTQAGASPSIKTTPMDSNSSYQEVVIPDNETKPKKDAPSN